MEYIRKSIYSRPEIRRTLLPLWSAWALTAVGTVCGVAMFMYKGTSDGVSSLFLGGVIVGVCSLLTVLCYWVFGDSRRPYSKELHTVLEPTYAYYPLSSEKAWWRRWRPTMKRLLKPSNGNRSPSWHWCAIATATSAFIIRNSHASRGSVTFPSQK